MKRSAKDPGEVQSLMAEGQGLVRSLAVRISQNIPFRMDLDDLVAYGQLGLAEAAHDFDPEEGCQFTTFAYYRIRGAIYDGLAKMSWTNRARYNKLRYQRMADETLRQSQSEEVPTPGDSVSDDATWFRNSVRRLGVVFLASHLGNEDEDQGSEFVDRAAPPPTVVASQEIAEKLRALMETLPHVERSILRNVYFEGTTLQEAADRAGVSKSWASRLHAKGLEQLARSLRQWGASG